MFPLSSRLGAKFWQNPAILKNARKFCIYTKYEVNCIQNYFKTKYPKRKGTKGTSPKAILKMNPSSGTKIQQILLKDQSKQTILSPNRQRTITSSGLERKFKKIFQNQSHFTESQLKLGDENEQGTCTFEKVINPFSQEYTSTMNQFTKIVQPITSVSNHANSESCNSLSIRPFSEKKQKKKQKQLWNLRGLSSQVKEYMANIQETTYKKIAKNLVEKMSVDHQVSQSNELHRENQNLKRRIYDSINVMVALGVLKKQGKIIRKGKLFNLAAQHSDEEEKRNLLKSLQSQLYERRIQMRIKRKFFREQTNKVINLNKLIDRNSSQLNQPLPIFNFPLVAASIKLEKGDDPLVMQMNYRFDEFKMLSKNPISISGDLDILQKLNYMVHNQIPKQTEMQME